MRAPFRFVVPWSLIGLLASAPAAAQPRVLNARQTIRSAAAGLEREFRAVIAAQTGPAAQAGPVWLGYSVPVVDGRHWMCCSGSWDSGRCCTPCTLDRDHGSIVSTERRPSSTAVPAGPVKLEAPESLLVLFRIGAARAVDRIRVFSEDCELDAGGLPFIWLTDVNPAQSVALLASHVPALAGDDETKRGESAVMAIALHAGAAADQTLETFLDPSRPEAIRKQVPFWLGSARGRRGYEVLRRIVRSDPSERVRNRAIFGLSVSKEPEAVKALMAVARDDESAKVRGQALFWLAQKAGKQAAAAITDAIERDPQTEVKKKAVFALSQLPPDEGVPLLIQVARTNSNPAVRKQAMFWLGQSRDPRALKFFEEILAREH